MTSTNKYELATAIDNILNSSSEVVDTVEKGHQLRRKIAQKLAFELDEYINLQIVPGVTGSILNVTNNFINSRIASAFPIDPAAHIPGLRTLGYTGNSAMPGNAAAGGDLSGNYPNPTVVGIYGNPVVSTTPTTNDVLTWNGTAWTPAAGGGGGGGPPTGAAGGDLGGTYPNPDVVALQSYAVASTAPTTNDVLTWNGSAWEPAAIPAPDTGLLFDLDTTVATDVSSTTEVQGKGLPGGSVYNGTITVAGNIAAPWDSATKLLQLTTSAAMYGIGLHQVECGSLPAEGFILDVGIGNLDVLLNTYLVIAFYEQRTGVNGRGVGIGIQNALGQLNMIGFADDGTDSPAINTSPLTFMSADSWGGAPANFNRGPARAIMEFRKVDASSPERWTLRVTLISIGGVTSQTYSGIAYPATGWSTSLDLAGATMDRVGIGAWATSNEGGDMSISHLRIYSLGSVVPT
jgi:hypothetical protein